MNLTFDQLPEAVTNLTKEVSALRQMLISKEHSSTEQPEKFLTIQQAAAFLCLSVPTIYTKVSKRELPVMKRGKRLYFSAQELTDYLKNGKKKSFAEMEGESGTYLLNTKK